MADLMTDSFSYNTLESQYGNFIVPALKINIDGSDTLKALGLIIEDITITLSTNGSGSVVFKIAGMYEEKNHSFRSDIKSKFQLGTVVEVEVGYLSTTHKVFKGYVAMLGAEFGDKHLLIVTLMDARRLMMSNGKKKVVHNVKNYSDAVKNILKNYEKLFSAQIEDTSDSLSVGLYQNSTDFDFISKTIIEKARLDREFFIFADKAYFRKSQKITAPVLTMKYGRELQNLKVEFPYIDLQVDVIGYDPKEQKRIKSSKQVLGFIDQKKIVGKTPVFTDLAPDAGSQDSVQSRTGALARVSQNKNCTGSGSSIGLPEIVPGRYLKIESLEKMVDHLYYIKEVTHVINEKSFITNFEIGGVM